MLDLLDDYGASGTGTGSSGNKVRVVNPQTKEQFEIDAADLPAAQAEGFVQQ